MTKILERTVLIFLAAAASLVLLTIVLKSSSPVTYYLEVAMHVVAVIELCRRQKMVQPK